MTQFKSVRLPHYDYSSVGCYFVTMVAHNRACSFGSIIDGTLSLSEIGRVLEAEWRRSFDLRNELHLDCHVVMPNHLHGIVLILNREDDPLANERARQEIEAAHCRAAQPGAYRRSSKDREKKSISSFVAGFKSYSTKRVNELQGTPGARLWQPSYYEHVIRNDEELSRIRDYIAGNPANWGLDEENPSRQ